MKARSLGWEAMHLPRTELLMRPSEGIWLTQKIWNGAQQGVHVAEAIQTGSLGAVRLPAHALDLFEDSYQGKRSLRAYLNDGHACYNLPIVAKNLREVYRSNGIEAVQQVLPVHGDVHIRLGLARAWAELPGKCSLMINGIYG